MQNPFSVRPVRRGRGEGVDIPCQKPSTLQKLEDLDLLFLMKIKLDSRHMNEVWCSLGFMVTLVVRVVGFTGGIYLSLKVGVNIQIDEMARRSYRVGLLSITLHDDFTSTTMNLATMQDQSGGWRLILPHGAMSAPMKPYIIRMVPGLLSTLDLGSCHKDLAYDFKAFLEFLARQGPPIIISSTQQLAHARGPLPQLEL
uniref:Uncharacterized protein n=1 Tax=Cannabis sativa TaxID=3483 RepID=A0A803QBD2_CANSA